jgi:hypothetical protein
MTDLEVISAAVTAFASLVIAAFTVTLACVGRRQMRDARAIQRAFLSVNANGIDTNTFGDLLGQVIFENVGGVAARNVLWRVNINSSATGDWKPPKLTAADLEGRTVLPVGAKWKIGSGKCDPAPKERWEFVFVWGRVEYTDSLEGQPRFTDFCHRYPWARHVKRIEADVIDYSVSEDYARFHHAGNDAD